MIQKPNFDARVADDQMPVILLSAKSMQFFYLVPAANDQYLTPKRVSILRTQLIFADIRFDLLQDF